MVIQHGRFARNYARVSRQLTNWSNVINQCNVPGFSQEVKRRDDWIPKFDWPDEDILVDLDSNAAKSDRVEDLLKRGSSTRSFTAMQLRLLPRSRPRASEICDGKRSKTDIRFKYKVERMIGYARCLLRIRERHGSSRRISAPLVYHAR